MAGFAPAFGLWMRDVSVWRMHLFQESTNVALPMLLLAFLLFNAGLGIRIVSFREWARSYVSLSLGVIRTLFFPLLYILAVSQLMRFGHDPEGVQNILVGQALVASMPIAVVTALVQNANGDMTLSLGLVLLFHFSQPEHDACAAELGSHGDTRKLFRRSRELAGYGTGAFLMLFVLLPSLVGIAARVLAGDGAINRIKPYQKALNTLVLLLLSYSSAAVSLPAAIHHPDSDFLVARWDCHDILRDRLSGRLAIRVPCRRTSNRKRR